MACARAATEEAQTGDVSRETLSFRRRGRFAASHAPPHFDVCAVSGFIGDGVNAGPRRFPSDVRKVYNYRQDRIMNRTASLCVTMLAAAVLEAQGPPRLKRFPPDIGPATVTVTGVGGKAIDLTAADLFNLPQHTVRTTDHGTPATFEGVLLADVLAKVDLPAGEKFHSTAAGYYLVVEATDGYRAVFAWAELDSTFMDKAVYLVTHRDGKPLPANEGPFQLVAPGEKRNARWVRQVTALTIRQAS
jgi:hypothetical protein